MQQSQFAEPDFGHMLAAPATLRDRKGAVAQKARLYAGAYALALLACLVLIFYAGWMRWIGGFLVAACVVVAWSMRAALTAVARGYAAHRMSDSVLVRHRVLNVVALALLAYALLAVWRPWPLPVVAVLLAAVINYVHYVGYRDDREVGP